MNGILSIDQGTTGNRAIIYDRQGRVIADAYQEFRQYFPRPGWVEHDAEEIWQSVRKVIARTINKAPGVRIKAIGITNQRETTVIWDRATGKPIHPAIVWQCRRTAHRCAVMQRRKGMQQLIRTRTGLPLDAYFSATKIEWILKHVPGAMKRARNGELCFGTTDSWLLWNLTKGAVHATDYTNAARTLIFNITTRVWDKRLLDIFSIPETLLPEVRPSSGIFGETAKIASLPAGIPIAGIAGDQQAALFGQGCFRAGTVKNTYGTGCFMLLNTGEKCIRSRHGLITTLGCDAKGKPVYVLEGAIFIAGAAIQWLRDGLGVLKNARDSEAAAVSVDDNGGVYFVPALTGLGAPYWFSAARGAIYGLTRGTKKEHLIRAALEAMCYQTKDVLNAMRKDSGLKIQAFKVDGGAVRNNFLCQFQADILQCEVIRPRVIESTSLGAAYLAGLAVGYWPDAAAIQKCWKKDRSFYPLCSATKAAGFYKDWQAAVKKTIF